MKQKRWFKIEPYVHISLCNDSVLLFNTLDKQHIIIDDSNQIRILKNIIEDNCFNIMEVSNQIYSEDYFISLVKTLENRHMGELFEHASEIAPIQLTPYLNIRKEKAQLDNKDENITKEGTLQFLNELTIFINSECHQNCDTCSLTCKQFIYCFKEEKKGYLDHSIILHIISQIQLNSRCKINLVGGDIFLHKEIIEILFFFNENRFSTHVYSYYKSIDFEILKNYPNLIIDVLIDNPHVLAQFTENIPEDFNNTLIFHFILKSEIDLINIVESIGSINLKYRYRFHPFYDRNNYNFFKNRVFLEKQDILDMDITMQTIFRNQTLNTMSFGSLFIASNGDIYSNLNKPKLGNIRSSNLEYFVHLEYKNGKSWFNIREDEPCLHCHYQWLCPSPNNYELIIGKPNLCHVKT